MKKKNFLSLSVLALSVMMFTNCQDEAFSDVNQETQNSDKTSAEVYGGVTGNVVTKNFFGNKTKFKEAGGNLVVGDMILTPEQVEKSNLPYTKGVIENFTEFHWPKTGNDYTIAYDIDPNLPNKNRVTDAMNHWKGRTKFNFVRRTNQQDYVYFTDLGGCSSFIGRVGGRQDISVGINCTTGNTIHEIGHAVGMFHEQSHPRRDDYISVNFENITPGFEGNFIKQSFSNVFTTGFDLGSIMMYGSFFFSNNGEPTIVKKDGSTFNIQRRALSRGDILAIEKVYN